MREEFYRQEAQLAEHHWWSSARRKILRKVMQKYILSDPLQEILEVGCSTGVAADSTASPPMIPMGTGFFTCDDTDIVDLGLKAGVGFQGYFFTVDVALTWGISSMYESSNLSIKNRVLSITIGLGRP